MPKYGLDSADNVIIGSGMGGATMAWLLAETGARRAISFRKVPKTAICGPFSSAAIFTRKRTGTA
ncbi:Geranylgeranyl reductase family protein (fragment) [Agrobacterium fabrum str. J-07]